MLFFFSKYQDPENTIPAEGRRVVEFRENMMSKSNCFNFNDRVDFENKLREWFDIQL